MNNDLHPVKRWTLEYTGEQAGQLLESAGECLIDWMSVISPDRFLDLYRRVGDQLGWFDRLMMPESELRAILSDPNRQFGVLRDPAGDEAGLVEICRHAPNDTEFVYFGLFPECVGMGVGRSVFSRLLLHALEITEEGGRIRLSTCEWDSPAALPFYQRMGFRIVSEDVKQQRIPPGIRVPPQRSRSGMEASENTD